MTSAVLVIAIAILVLAQGGFFSLAPCLCGVVISIVAGIAWLRKGRRERGIPIIPLLFTGVALTYLISALVNGASLTTIGETGTWAACAGAAFLSAAQQPKQRSLWMRVLAWFGIATAVAGVFQCAGILQFDDGMWGTRLQFTFQYANATAAWSAVITFLCLLSPDKYLKMFAAIPAAAMLLTQSGGALIVFALAAIVIGIMLARADRWEDLLNALVQGVIAIALFATVHATMSPASLACLAAGVLICWAYGKFGDRIQARINPRAACIALAAIIVVCAIAALALMSDRVAEAVKDFGTRGSHMHDGLALWSMQPILGVGPDNWKYLYPYIQTAPYYTTVVHCSYIQILLDAGIPGIAFFAAAYVLGMRQLVRQRKDAEARNGWALAELAAMAFLLVHAVLDFDLQFASLAFVLTASLSAPDGPAISAHGSTSLITGLLCLIVCLPISAAGLLCATTSTTLELANASGDYETCEKDFEANPLAQGDVAAQSQYVAAFYAQGRYDIVIDMYGRMLAPTSRDTLCAAHALYSMGNKSKATAVLIERMENCPYDSSFLDGALQLTNFYGTDSAQTSHFNMCVEQMRALTGSNG